jgi:hypothetical protein
VCEGEFAGDKINEMSFQKFDCSAQLNWAKAGNLTCLAMSPLRSFVSQCCQDGCIAWDRGARLLGVCSWVCAC